MDVNEQIKRLQQFLESYYYHALLEAARKGAVFIVVDFIELAKFDPEIADLILDEPEEVLKSLQLAVENMEVVPEPRRFNIRFCNIPESQKVMIKDIRSKHLNKFLIIEGLVKQKSDVRPQVTLAKFECSSCGNIISVYQVDTSFKEPSKCSCGKKRKFKVLDKEMVDAQRIVIEESPEELEGGEQPKRLSVFLKADLVSPLSERKTNPGSKIRVVGVIKEIPITLKTGAKSTTFDLFMDSNYIEAKEESFSDISLSKEDIAEIKAMAADPGIYEKFVNSIAPSIYGHEKVKEALILQLMGGVRKKRDDGVITRGDVHILLVGDPGAGKSQLLKRISKIAPKSRYISGKGISGAGLTATVVRDEFLRGWSLEAGALALTNGGYCFIDELDKMSPEDRDAMHEALEQQSISIAKANIQATLRAETTVLAAANPKFGRFAPYDPVAKQIDLPPTLISRFDLIFPIKDLPDEDRDASMAEFILKLHKNASPQEVEFGTDTLKKYISYAKSITPVLTDEALVEIKDYYVKMRAMGKVEGDIVTIPITARQLEALVRLAEASAKVRLSNEVKREDAIRAIKLIDYCLMLVGMDRETGTLDIDRITIGVAASQRSKMQIVRSVIEELEKATGKEISIKEVIEECRQKGVSDKEVDEIIDKLKRLGDLYEPTRGRISRVI